jgi:hypothetical protein
VERNLPAVLFGAAALGGASIMTGVFFDTSWHRSLGRDTFFIWPHLAIFLGAYVVGMACFTGVAMASLGWASAFGGTVLRLGPARLPVGYAIACVGVLVVLAAGPIDAFWHWLYGKDVLIWSFPHLLLYYGGGLAAVGLLLAVASEKGRGPFRRLWLWRIAMVMVLEDLVHRSLFVLAHYTQVPETRTPDFYPLLLSLFLPMIFVVGARAVGAWAPPAASALYLVVCVLVDVGLRLMAFERYTLTPFVVVPALAISLLYRVVRRPGSAALAVASGLLFTLVFTTTEAWWMWIVVGRPWPMSAVVAALPWSLLAGAGSGWVGWALGGFLLAAEARSSVAEIFGSPRRAARVAAVALVLTVIGVTATYRPQRFGPPMTVAELALTPMSSVRYQDSLFWVAILDPLWRRSSSVVARSEGIIEGLTQSIGPAWCASTDAVLAGDLAGARFHLQINGEPVDLSRFPIVTVRMRDGHVCGWVGLGAQFQRGSDNHFVYTIDVPGRRDGVQRITASVRVVFKDP